MIQIKNQQLLEVLHFLDALALSPKPSRVRTKLMQKVQQKIEELYRDELELLEQYGKKNEQGKLVEEDGSYPLIEATATEYHKEKRELLAELATLDVGEFQDNFSFLIEALENIDTKFSGQEATTLDFILNFLEKESEEK